MFYDKLNYVTGVEVGFGGVWIGAAPHLLFIPDKNRDDVPDELALLRVDRMPPLVQEADDVLAPHNPLVRCG